MQNNMLKVQEDRSWPKKVMIFLLPNTFFSKFGMFVSLTNKVENIPR